MRLLKKAAEAERIRITPFWTVMTSSLLRIRRRFVKRWNKVMLMIPIGKV